MTEPSILSNLVEQWATKLGWRLGGEQEEAVITVSHSGEESRVEIAFVPEDAEAMVELWDTKRVRGGIFSVHYGEQPAALLDIVRQFSPLTPDKFPSLIAEFTNKFDTVTDISGVEPIRIDDYYLATLRQQE